MTEWDETRSILGRRAAAVLLAGEALYVLIALLQIAADEDTETGESLAPVAAALSIVLIPLLIAFGATAWMLWRGRIWPAGTGRSRAARNFVAVGIVVLINGALAFQLLVGAMTLSLETSRAFAGFAGLIVATACLLLIRDSWRERW
jgi:hypothetical protein